MSNNAPAPQKIDTRKTKINPFTLLFNKLGIYVVVIGLMILGMLVSKGQFFTASNIQSILEAVALQGMVAAGLTFVVYSGNMNDMSLPMTMAFAGMMSTQCINFGFVPTLLISILTGVVIGLINGFMIGKLRANPVIWTWGFNLLLSGIVRVVWGGKQIYADTVSNGSEFSQKAVEVYYAISRTYIGGIISVMAIVMIVMFIIAWFIHSRTTFGNQLRIVGTSYDVAKFSGINCPKIVTTAYVINGIFASIGGVFYTALRKTASYENGTGYDFSCLTAVLLGGVLLSGGKGNMVGVFGGVLAYGILNNILSWVGLGTYEKYLVQGIVFLFIVWLNTYSNRKLGKA